MPKTIAWLAQEDQMLAALVQQYKHTTSAQSIPWKKISSKMAAHISSDKSSRQCQSRWNYSLRPGKKINSLLTQTEENTIFSMQRQYGNKWTLISSHFQGKQENFVKNFFYAALRKSIRTINSHMRANRSQSQYKKAKAFSQSCVSKIVAQQQGKGKKMRVNRTDINHLARQISFLLIEIYKAPKNPEMIERCIALLREFNRSCKRIKKKSRYAKSKSGLKKKGSDEGGKKRRRLTKRRYRLKNIEGKDEQESIEQYEDESDSIENSSFSNESSDFSQENNSESENSRILDDKKYEMMENGESLKAPTIEFWGRDEIIYQSEPSRTISKQEIEKKDWKSLVPTKDADEEEEAEEQKKKQNQSSFDREYQIAKTGVDSKNELSLDGILNLPALDVLISKRNHAEEREENMFVFRDQELRMIDSSMELEFFDKENCSDNEYFS